MTQATVGARFRVTAIKEVRTPKFRLLARYHPTHPETGDPLDYGVTLVNIKMVNAMIEEGVAVIESAGEARKAAAGMVLASSPAKLKGKVTVGKPKKKGT